jgi:hypothetical protein
MLKRLKWLLGFDEQTGYFAGFIYDAGDGSRLH